MADVEQMKKIVPLITCEITDVPNLYFRIKINPVKQPIQSNSVGSGLLTHASLLDFGL